MNTPVSFEIAKLLKEKGFDSYITSQYIQFDYSDNSWKLKTNQEYKDLDSDIGIGNKIRISAPTIAEVVMWLYEKYEKWLIVRPYLGKWVFEVQKKPSPLISCTSIHNYKLHNSPTEAYEAAIEYCLTKLL